MPGVGQQWYAVEDTKKHAAKRCDCYACISHGQKWLCLCALVAGASQALALQFCCFFAVRAGGWLCANRLAVRDEVVHLPQPRQGPLQRAPGALQRAQQLRRAEGVRGMAATQTGAQALDVQLAWLYLYVSLTVTVVSLTAVHVQHRSQQLRRAEQACGMAEAQKVSRRLTCHDRCLQLSMSVAWLRPKQASCTAGRGAGLFWL
jgi:hypothetical protein